MDEPIVIRSNSDSRVCVDVVIIDDNIAGEYYEVFLVRLTRTSTSIFVDRVVVVILDQGQCTLILTHTSAILILHFLMDVHVCHCMYCSFD